MKLHKSRKIEVTIHCSWISTKSVTSTIQPVEKLSKCKIGRVYNSNVVSVFCAISNSIQRILHLIKLNPLLPVFQLHRCFSIHNSHKSTSQPGAETELSKWKSLLSGLYPLDPFWPLLAIHHRTSSSSDMQPVLAEKLGKRGNIRSLLTTSAALILLISTLDI